MRGVLTISGREIRTFGLDIYHLCNHLMPIENVRFMPAEKTGNNFFDVVLQVYLQASIGSLADKRLIPLLFDEMKRIFGAPEHHAKLKELGATETDFALINCDKAKLTELAAHNTETDIYKLAGIYRLARIANNFVNSDGTPLTEYSDLLRVTIPVGSFNIALNTLSYYAFAYSNTHEEPHNVLISIHDAGDKTWNYNDVGFRSKYIRGLFDTVISFGNGSAYLLPQEVSNFFSTAQILELASKGLDFAVVMLELHDDKESGKFSSIVGALPKLAKTTLYIIDSCYSGKYHAIIQGECHLITSGSSEEASLTSDFDKIEYFSKYIPETGPNLTSFLHYFATEYTHSTPHFSGSIDGRVIKNQPIKDLPEISEFMAARGAEEAAACGEGGASRGSATVVPELIDSEGTAAGAGCGVAARGVGVPVETPLSFGEMRLVSTFLVNPFLGTVVPAEPVDVEAVRVDITGVVAPYSEHQDSCCTLM